LRNSVEERCEEALLTTFNLACPVDLEVVDGQEEQTRLELLKPGDLIAYKPAQRFRWWCDHEGAGLVDQQI